VGQSECKERVPKQWMEEEEEEEEGSSNVITAAGAGTLHWIQRTSYRILGLRPGGATVKPCSESPRAPLLRCLLFPIVLEWETL
jgi:hypothetical protein